MLKKKRKLKNAMVILSLVWLLCYLFKHEINKFNSSRNIDEQQASDDFKIFDSNQWVFNLNVSQKSSFLIRDSSNRSKYEVESIVILDNLTDRKKTLRHVKKYIKCLIRFKPGTYTMVDASKFIYIRFNVWKIGFELTHQGVANDAAVAVIDSKYFDYYLKLFEKSTELLAFQRPYFYDRKSNEAKKEVANCVHMVRVEDEMRFKRLLDWIDLQFHFGYRKLKFYIYQMNTSQMQTLRRLGQEKYGLSDLIEIDEYKIDRQTVCQWSLHLIAKNSESKLFQFLHESCLKKHLVYFNEQNMKPATDYFRRHGLICTNECLTQLRNEYELITNCDFDEFIFPRHDSANDLQLASGQAKCEADSRIDVKISPSYNIYDYAKRLIEKYESANRINQISSIRFENIVFFADPKQLIQNIAQNLNENILEFVYEKKNMKFKSRANSVKWNKAEHLKALIPYLDCLNSSSANKNHKNYDHKWNNYIAAKGGKVGKAIYVGKHVETMIQHYGLKNNEKTKSVLVPIEDGYVSHFRERFPSVSMQRYVDELQFDVEYYFYFLALSNNKLD